MPEDYNTGYARKTKPNLVNMGTRNRRQKEKERIGSVTCEVVDNSDCPTLIIPENSTLSLDSTIKVLFATNFDQRTLNTLERMMLLMKKLDISIFFTHFSSETDSWNEVKLMGIKNYFSNHYKNIPCEYRVIHGKNLLEEISQQINDLGVNLVIVNSHKRNLFAKLLNPSTARKMILQSETPILVFHS